MGILLYNVMEAVVIAKQYGKSVIFRGAKNQNGVPGFIGFIKMTYEDVPPISVLWINRWINIY
jgi:hypothetical protein